MCLSELIGEVNGAEQEGAVVGLVSLERETDEAYQMVEGVGFAVARQGFGYFRGREELAEYRDDIL